MGNENVRNALRTAGLTPEEFADIIKVDPKTVQRWVAGTTTPYRRHRAAISRALNLAEHELWPEHAPRQDPGPADVSIEETRLAVACDVTGAWASADADNAPHLVGFINGTTGPIDVLDSCCGIQITDDLMDALLAQADAGRRVRILSDGQAPHWETLLDHPQIEIYLCEIPGGYWLIKTTDQMLLTINLEHDPGGAPAPPLMRLSQATEDGIFRRLANRFEELWAPTGAGDTEPGDIEDADELTEASFRTVRQRVTAGVAPDPDGRRWPRQPA